MPIIDKQRRLREAGRIRIGEKVPTSNGKSRPSKIDVFRFTSADEKSIRAVAEVYGGEVQEWADAPIGDQWELKSDAKSLDVIIPPVDLAYSQWYELWSGAGCVHRCDGQTDVRSSRPCPCSCDPDNRECRPTTRIAVIISAVDGIGTWRLETKGWNAAAEIDGAIEVLRVLQSKGQMVPGRLLLEQRQSKGVNEKTGKAETFNFAVPVLDLNLSVAALTAGASVPQLPSGVTPIAAPAEPVLSIRDQAAAVEHVAPKAPRANAAATLPATGVAPRPAAQAQGQTPITTPAGRRLFALLNGSSVGKDDDARHAWATEQLHRDVTSFSDLTVQDIIELQEVLKGTGSNKATVYMDGEEPF